MHLVARYRLILLFVLTLFVPGQLYAVPDRGYYLLSELRDAQQEANDNQIPLVWMSATDDYLNVQDPPDDSDADLAQMALKYLTHDLRRRVIVILVHGNDDMPKTPPQVHNQFHQVDDPNLPGGVSYLVPKLVFTSGDISAIFGRLSHTQMLAGRERAIYDCFVKILSNPDIRAKLQATPINPTPTPEPKATGASSFLTDPRKLLSIIAIVVIIGGALYASNMQKKQPRSRRH